MKVAEILTIDLQIRTRKNSAMLPLFCAAVVFLFLAIGAVAFVTCNLIPPLRKYSLSAALWCAVWGPCSVVWLLLTGLLLVANGFAMESAEFKHLRLPEVSRHLWTGYGIVALAGIAIFATFAALIHQWLLHRMTFQLFRMYAGLVSTGIGSVFGWCLWFWLVLELRHPHALLLSALGMAALCVAFGYAGWRYATDLRGKIPTRFGLVTQEEFEGKV